MAKMDRLFAPSVGITVLVVCYSLAICLVVETRCLGQAPTSAAPQEDEHYATELDAAVELYGDRKYATATERLSTITKQFPERSEAFYWFGLTLFQVQQWEEARKAFLRFSKLEPDSVDGKIWVAKVYLRERSYALAILWFRRVLALDATNEEATRLLALAKRTQERAIQEPAPPPVPACDDNKRRPTNTDNPGTVASGTDGTQAADDGSKDTASGNWWKGGYVGSFQASYRGWMTGGGIVLLLILWGIVASICVAIFTIPLYDEEVAITVVVCSILAVVFYVLWWGYGCWWGWLLLLLGIGQLSGGTIQTFKRS